MKKSEMWEGKNSSLRKTYEKATEKSSVQDFADTIKDNPAKLIEWAKREIKEYEALIKILEKK